MNITDHFELSDHEFEREFERGLLKPEVFGHEAHLRLAWIHINSYGIDLALSTIQAQLKNFVCQVGAPDKYNETLTIAAIKAVHHFTLKSKSRNFRNFIVEFPRLKYAFKEVMATHYTMDIFNSERAKKEYIKPDLLPFD